MVVALGRTSSVRVLEDSNVVWTPCKLTTGVSLIMKGTTTRLPFCAAFPDPRMRLVYTGPRKIFFFASTDALCYFKNFRCAGQTFSPPPKKNTNAAKYTRQKEKTSPCWFGKVQHNATKPSSFKLGGKTLSFSLSL